VTVTTVPVPYRGGTVEIEYAWLGRHRYEAPLVVFLHEGLGSASMWRDFPRRLCDAGGFRGLVYSRPGYGRSSPRPAKEHWPPSFMHEQSRDLLPALLRALDVDAQSDPPWLLGHSDGGSIALIHGATFPSQVAGLVVLAPHVFVEDVSISSIQAAQRAYLVSDLKEKLVRYHDDPDSAFWGWSDAWLHPEFRAWNIQGLLSSIRCPVLAIQGRDDEYGTLAQVRAIAAAVPDAELLVLERCGHAPHRAQPHRLTRAVVDFVTSRCAPFSATAEGRSN
jgi:pimeloyl-ACP methyl ester carboxylesterase